MKTKAYIITVLFTFFFTSCKNESKTNEVNSSNPEKKQCFSVEFDVVTDKDDDFAVYYTEDGTINFNGDQATWGHVKGQSDPQKVLINLNEEIIPTDIRIDLGIKKGADQGDVTVKTIKMDYYGRALEIRGSDFFKYFQKNDSIQTVVDEAKGTITVKKNPKSTVTPFYYPHQILLDEIKKITTSK